ncbi:MAG TPA: VOC family protein [Candidatus Lustribacter sp.]|jgi:2,3-dihydroxy-p-cumate/2,3-dihydroxybenzoate 3,4-dioxygenase|nr:VOC family protein [Candidatus Lustribacter sp.]
MIDLRRIRYVRIGTPDLGEATNFATKILGLEAAGRERGIAYFRSDDRDHTIAYVEGDPSQHATAFEVSENADLGAIAAELERAGHPVHAGTPAECEVRRVLDFISFQDPTGNTMEIVWRAQYATRRYFPSRDAGITGFSHIGLHTNDAPRDEQFWTRIFNARASDWIGTAPLLRINEVHHTIALFPSVHKGVQHINHQVASIDDVMRSWYFVREQRGLRVVFGPGRHLSSGAVFLYFEGLDKMVYEYSYGVRIIEDETTYIPRQLPFTAEAFCMWGAKPDIVEFRASDPLVTI